MARLFIFAIGGTGSRVLKSLAMLLASGVKPVNSNYEIIPIIIDPHQANKDLKRATDILELYQKVHDSCGQGNGFFDTRITTLKNLITTETQLTDTFKFNLQEVVDNKFKDYIGLDSFERDSPSKALLELLFSGKSINKQGNDVDLIDVEMDMGFIGNPNIGSVVLNQFKDSVEFKEFASNFNKNDRIFIISSIFGGTGAAGFPIILKNIRGAKTLRTEIDSKGFLENAIIGAITVLPYFNIKKDQNSPIQKSDFISKTKQALYYYKDNVTGNHSVNALYYIGDDYIGKPYENDPGDGGQQNDAHFVELAAALSIIDFLEIPDSKLTCSNGIADNPIYREFGIDNDFEKINFKDLSNGTQNKIALQIAQLYLFVKYIDEQLDKAITGQVWCKDEPEINSTYLSSQPHLNFIKFADFFKEWLKELAENKRAFMPINFKAQLQTIFEGIDADTGWLKRDVDYVLFDDILNSNSKDNKIKNAPQKLIDLFNRSTKELLIKKFDFFKNFKS